MSFRSPVHSCEYCCWYNRMLCLHTWSETGGIWGRRKFRWSWVAIGSDKDSGGAHVYFISLHCGEHFSMVKTAKMELLRALVSECLSAAAQEIYKIVERTIIEYEEEMSCSKWVVDSHRRLLDVASPHSEGQFKYFIYSIKDMPNIKHQNSSKVVKSWVCSSSGLQSLQVPALWEFFQHLPGFWYHRAQLS